MSEYPSYWRHIFQKTTCMHKSDNPTANQEKRFWLDIHLMPSEELWFCSGKKTTLGSSLPGTFNKIVKNIRVFG